MSGATGLKANIPLIADAAGKIEGYRSQLQTVGSDMRASVQSNINAYAQVEFGEAFLQNFNKYAQIFDIMEDYLSKTGLFLNDYAQNLQEGIAKIANKYR